MKVMNDTLPQSNTPSPVAPPGGVIHPTGGMAKETGPHISFTEAPLIQEVGQEMPLSNEVAKAGVTIQPTTIELPANVQKLGVKSIGANVPPVYVSSSTKTLPLTDEQIAQGLHQSVTSSWRWLAEWCERQLKQAHIMLKTIHGTITRSNA